MLHLSPLMVLWKRPLRRIGRVRREHHRTERPIVDPHLFTQSNPYSPTIPLVQKAVPVQPAHWTGWRKGLKVGPWRRTTLEHRAGRLLKWTMPTRTPCPILWLRYLQTASPCAAARQAKHDSCRLSSSGWIGRAAFLPCSDVGKGAPRGKESLFWGRTDLGHLVVARLRRC